jgi:hypothetical protein
MVPKDDKQRVLIKGGNNAVWDIVHLLLLS